MKHSYVFDDKELAFLKPVQDAIAQNQAELNRRLKNIAEINGLTGNLTADSTGFLAPDTEAPSTAPDAALDPRSAQALGATAL